MTTKIIDDRDFYDLLELHYKLQQLLPAKLNKSSSALALLEELQKLNARGIGLYKDNKLVGFVNGYDIDGIYYFSNIYVLQDSRIGVKQLMSYAEQIAVSLGYTISKAESCLNEGKRVLQHFGYKEI